jgi:hypothetical protein
MAEESFSSIVITFARMLPNLVIIGTAKGGTTSIYHYLDAHPEIAMARPKGMRFFLDDGHWHRGQAWYESHFDTPAPVRGEASAAYTSWPFLPNAAERIAAMIPNARLVYLVRDPLERIVADYFHAFREHGDTRPFLETVLPFEESLIVARSRYATQLERYLALFPAEQILVVDTSELGRGTADTMARIYRFLGVADDFRSPIFDERFNTRKRRVVRNRIGERVARALDAGLGEARAARLRAVVPEFLHSPFVARVRAEFPPHVRADLVDYLRPEVERLRALTGLPLASWSI